MLLDTGPKTSAQNLWHSYASESLRGFIFDKFIINSDIIRESTDLHIQFINVLNNFKLEERESPGDGCLYQIIDNDWQGICLVKDDIPIHFYVVKRQ
ncbi:MAG: hypothetical protein JW779_13880 [Candidatus Thorarchaeota archaeon]|nr:hypothetical protein [Candidatus Thorarchaeota archaeon]